MVLCGVWLERHMFTSYENIYMQAYHVFKVLVSMLLILLGFAVPIILFDEDLESIKSKTNNSISDDISKLDKQIDKIEKLKEELNDIKSK